MSFGRYGTLVTLDVELRSALTTRPSHRSSCQHIRIQRIRRPAYPSGPCREACAPSQSSATEHPLPGSRSSPGGISANTELRTSINLIADYRLKRNASTSFLDAGVDVKCEHQCAAALAAIFESWYRITDNYLSSASKCRDIGAFHR